MIRTLYGRVVLTFLAAVVFGLIASFFITTYLYRDRVAKEIQEEMLSAGTEMVKLYARLGTGDIGAFIQSMNAVGSYNVSLLRPPGASDGEMRPPPGITPEIAGKVLRGEIYRGGAADPGRIIVGIPFRIGGEPNAIFMEASRNRWETWLVPIIHTSLAITLAAGSLFIFVAAQYLVKPLRAMTAATRRLARGDFNVEMKWNRRRDEIGELSQSFQHMVSELRQLEQMRQDFVSNVSHEIQSPLTSISGFSKALRNKDMPEEERLHYLDIIRTESERLSRLSENLLKLASLESERHPFHPRTYDLDEQLRHVVVACAPQWMEKTIELDVDLPPLKIHADEDQLSQVWLNLLGNSIKFTPPGGKIRIRAAAGTREIGVSIADNGIGISQADRERIFERFFKADRSRNRTLSGSGLGLAIAHKIVALHGGRIEVDSEPGRGSVFTVILPGYTK
ncbi:sensor histidine kinase [Paenibacillus hamazuiensis]|uniref:sensor histidine kinase n=1 Tax=Paenibacillus hamazuiensis TaxID=2936508 RepID=UPI00200DEF46|nr:HAMP domain-containing sensor histidine kinase [Paenibacillus hamazuiensis]